MSTLDPAIAHIRPRFKLVVNLPPEQVMTRVRGMIAEKPDGISGRVVQHHVILDIVGEDVHFWSPQLNFRVEALDDDPSKTLVAGLIGPRPAVWTLFMFIYFSIALAGFVLSSIGLSRWMLGDASRLVWAFPLALLFALTARQVGKYGERLAADQVNRLKHFVREAISPV